MRSGSKVVGTTVITALLGGASVLLALHRIYGMDEVQNAFWARIIGRRAWADYEAGIGIYLFGPLAALARHASRSASLLFELRIVFLCLFWVNVLLLARLAGTRFRSGRGLTFLLGAATLAPLWDFGMDVRHDNVLLLELLLIWSLGRQWVERLGATWAYCAIGFVACAMEFTHFKGFVYALPASAILLLFPHPSLACSRFRLAIALAAGVLAGLAAGWGVHTTAGTWPIVVATISSGLRFSSQILQQKPSATLMVLPSHTIVLQRLAAQTPLLVGSILSFFCFCVWEVRERGKAWFTGATSCPEALLALAAFGAFFVNPTPFPYILLLLVPQIFLAVSRLAPVVSRGLAAQPRLLLPVCTLLIVAQLVPFVSATLRHRKHLNSRQAQLADLAEQLTDPKTDRVWDAMGLVTTRESIGFRWYLVGMNIRHFLDGTWPPIREMLALKPASVIIRSYRTDWLVAEDQKYISQHYIALSDELLVLGERISAQGRSWVCLHEGRYFFGSRERVAQILVDDVPLAQNPKMVTAGPHMIRTSPPTPLLLMWVGPRLQQPPQISMGDHRTLYPGWY